MDAIRYELPSGMKLNIGCGPIQPDGWVNVDGSNRAWLAARLSPIDKMLTRAGILSPTEFGPHIKILNLYKSLPYKNDCVSCIYAGEVWEHFEYQDAVRLTDECFRVLAPGGVLRICVPDGIVFWQRYLELYHDILAKPKHERSARPLWNHVNTYFRDICTRKLWLGSMGHKHKWQFDELQLVELFENRGFCPVERRQFHHSRIPDVSSVERSDFLIVEGVKPGRT